MAEILGLGLSHFPLVSAPDRDMACILSWTLDDPAIPDAAKDPANWPSRMREEWGDDLGERAAAGHRAAMVAGFDRVRRALDEFEPDVVVIWGDDQYENFKEDLVPPYAILAYDDMTVRPWGHAQKSSAMLDRANIWDEGEDHEFTLRGLSLLFNRFELILVSAVPLWQIRCRLPIVRLPSYYGRRRNEGFGHGIARPGATAISCPGAADRHRDAEADFRSDHAASRSYR